MLISSAFTALLNCAEVGRRNRILTNYRFLSHSLLSFVYFPTVLRYLLAVKRSNRKGRFNKTTVAVMMANSSNIKKIRAEQRNKSLSVTLLNSFIKVTRPMESSRNSYLIRFLLEWFKAIFYFQTQDRISIRNYPLFKKTC